MDYKGTIVFVAYDKGFGFIVSRDKPFERIYFHWSGLIQDTLKFKQLKKGMNVIFDVIEQDGTKGAKAIDIEVTKDGGNLAAQE